MTLRKALFNLLAFWLVFEGAAAVAAEGRLLYVGSYTSAKSKGIRAMRFDADSGTLTDLGLAAELRSPSFLAVHPDGKHLYAVSEVDDFGGEKSGGVAAFSINRDSGKLTLLNEAASGGTGPCFLSMDKAGKHLLVANYGGGSVSTFAVESDGKLGAACSKIQHEGSSVNPDRQKEAHAHSINLDAANRFAIAADLGLDKLLVYRFDAATGRLAANDPPFAKMTPGSGPRHLAFHPNGKLAFIINEMACTVTPLTYNADRGVITPHEPVSTLPPGVRVKPEYSTAEVVVHPSGKFLYGSNRGHDTIAVYSINADKESLTYLENTATRGKTPRNFVIDPTGKWLLAENQSSDTIAVFAIDQATGKLTAKGELVDAASPVCIRFVPGK
jgi:6-phosphogluconolactonase